MGWTIKLMYAVILTSMAGGILFGIWYLTAKMLAKIGYVRITYLLLKLLLVLWCVPFVYVIVKYDNDTLENGRGFLMAYTPIINIISYIFVFAWLIFVTVRLFLYLINIYYMYKRVFNSFECEIQAESIFEKVCKELNIKSKAVSVKQSYSEAVPICCGIFRPTVILPVQPFTEDELRIIFVHELYHYKHRDTWVKHIAFFISCIHSINPAIYVLEKNINKWGEFYCDSESIKKIGSVKKYFQFIFDMSVSNLKHISLYSPLVERKSEIEYRIEQIERSRNMIKHSKILACLCICIMIIVSTTSVYAATYAANEIYSNAYHSTVVDIAEEVTEDGLIEYTVSGLDSSIEEEIGESVLMNRSGNRYSFNWIVPKNTSRRTADYNISSGSQIYVSAYGLPTSITYRLGIVEPSGVRRYVSGTGGVSHTFSINSSGNYSVYIQNMSTTTSLDIECLYGW